MSGPLEGARPGGGPARYELRVQGVLDAGQAALHGLLTKIRDPGLPLVSVRRTPSGRLLAY